jgi:hypothetical protein
MAGLVLILFFCVGCTAWSELRPHNGTVVEMPRPSEDDKVERQPPVQNVNVDTENIERIVEGLILPDGFIWSGKATYHSGNKKREFTSAVYVDHDRFFAEVSEENRLSASALCDGTYTYILKPSGGVAQKIAKSQRFTYQTIGMAASIGSILPTDRTNRKEAIVSLYNGKNCIYVEIQNNKILEKYYLDVEWGYPLRVECYFGETLVYTFDTISFSQETPPAHLFALQD